MSPRKKSRGSGRTSEQKNNRTSSRHESRGGSSHKAERGFQFVDRSGKVHGVSTPRKPAAASEEGSRPGYGFEGKPKFQQEPRGKRAEPGKRAERGNRTEHEQRPRKASSQERGPSSPWNKKSKRGPEPERGPRREGAPRGGKRNDKRGRGRSQRYGGEAVTLKATVDKNRKGFGFLIFANRKFEDAFLPPRLAENLFHGDRVEVSLDPEGEILEIQVLEHRFREVVGKYTPHPSGADERGGWVVYERKRAREEIYVPRVSKGAKADDWVRAKLEFHESGPYPVTAEVTEVFGATLPASADLGMVAAEYNLVEEHSPAAEAEARAFKLEIDSRREDLRQVPFITIDGETARDFDDAVYVERKGSNFLLWVAIADVSHYVKPGTALDQEAFSRATSVYFPERAFHMLPRALSENLCSLRPHEPRLAMTARIELDRKGKIISTELMDSVIESKRRATYNEIQTEWEQNQNNPKWEFAPHFELYQILRRMRSDRGSLDFDFPEAELKVTPDGEVESLTKRGRFDAHRLIEHFMITANEAVTEWALAREWPFIYRVHEEPAEQALDRFQELAATMGVKVTFSGESLPEMLSDLIRRLENHPAQALLNMALLRSMKQAVYSATHGIHFGLASEAYTHFTSPIRRYPDLIVHRMLRHALHVEKGWLKRPGQSELEKLEDELHDAAEHCSYRERIATEAERESIKLKQVRLMTRYLGEEFDAKVIGMVESGLFVEIGEPFVEGMISVESMTDDFYQFNEERMVFYGRRKRRTFQIGDAVKVRLLRADIDRRQIDFGLLEHYPSGESLDLELRRPRRKQKAGRDEKSSDKRGGKGKGPARGKGADKKSGRRGRR